MRYKGGITTFLITVLITITLIQSAHGENWPMFLHDLEHSGTSGEIVELPVELLWNYSTAFPIESSPVVSEGVLYIGDNGGIYALNAITGSMKWKYKTGEIHSVPAVTGGIAYAGSDDQNVYAFDAVTGILKWKYKTAG